LKAMKVAAPNDNGAVLAELAIVVSLILLLLGGIFDAAWLIRQNDIAEQASRHAARSGVAVFIPCDTPPAPILERTPCSTITGLSGAAETIAEAGCQYLILSDLNPAEWEIEASQTAFSLNENGVQVNSRMLHVVISQTASNCLFCLQNVFDMLVRSETRFLVMGCTEEVTSGGP